MVILEKTNMILGQTTLITLQTGRRVQNNWAQFRKKKIVKNICLAVVKVDVNNSCFIFVGFRKKTVKSKKYWMRKARELLICFLKYDFKDPTAEL